MNTLQGRQVGQPGGMDFEPGVERFSGPYAIGK